MRQRRITIDISGISEEDLRNGLINGLASAILSGNVKGSFSDEKFGFRFSNDPAPKDYGGGQYVMVDRFALNSLIGMANSHTEDIRSGIEEGLYDAMDNEDIDDKEASIAIATRAVEGSAALPPALDRLVSSAHNLANDFRMLQSGEWEPDEDSIDASLSAAERLAAALPALATAAKTLSDAREHFCNDDIQSVRGILVGDIVAEALEALDEPGKYSLDEDDPRVAIMIKGGCVTEVVCDRVMNVTIFDRDVEGAAMVSVIEGRAADIQQPDVVCDADRMKAIMVDAGKELVDIDDVNDIVRAPKG